MDLLAATSKLRIAFQDVAKMIDGEEDRLSVSDLLMYCAETTPSAIGKLCIVSISVQYLFICMLNTL